MAIGRLRTNTASNTAARRPLAVSVNPDELVQGGLPTNFIGTIIETRAVPWNYGGKARDGKFSLAIRRTIQPDDDQEVTEPVIAYYSAGDLAKLAPSTSMYALENAGGFDADDFISMAQGQLEEQPTAEQIASMEGIYLIPISEGAKGSSSTNNAHYQELLLKAGFPKSAIGLEVNFDEGLRGRWDRVPQKKRDNMEGQAAEGERKKEILACTEILDLPPSAGGKKATASSKPAVAATAAKKAAPKPAEPEEGAEDETDDSGTDESFEDTVAAAIVSILAANDGDVDQKRLPALIQRALKGTGNEPDGIKLVANNTPESKAFLAGRPEWDYSKKTNRLTAIEAEEEVVTEGDL